MLSKIKRLILRTFPKWQANRLYKLTFGRSINWKNPTEFNEKLRWLQFNTDTSKWTLLADKYRVREYLTEKGYGDLLVKLYGVWESADDIDFNKLPDSFVIKTNNGSGGVFVVKDKNSIDLEDIREKLRKQLKEPFGIETAEPHYLGIKPLIIAEELLEQDGNESSSLVDYKFFCTKGEPQFCTVMYNRNIMHHEYDVKMYDNNWQDISFLMTRHYDGINVGKIGISKPRNIETMHNFCREICSEFPFVRMDFYECQGRLYFGEFTFTPSACVGRPIGPEASKILSDKLLIK